MLFRGLGLGNPKGFSRVLQTILFLAMYIKWSSHCSRHNKSASSYYFRQQLLQPSIDTSASEGQDLITCYS
jgi:hypothetical protein